MPTWSKYRRTDGLFTGQRFTAKNARVVADNVDDQHALIEGAFDHLSQRVDIQTGDVVDYQPPRPSDDHEWNAVTKRWQRPESVELALAQGRRARAEIQLTEQSSARAQRELLLLLSVAAGLEGRPEHRRLQEVDDAIAGHRSLLQPERKK
jgi:hypothetical protein